MKHFFSNYFRVLCDKIVVSLVGLSRRFGQFLTFILGNARQRRAEAVLDIFFIAVSTENQILRPVKKYYAITIEIIETL